MAYFLFPEAKHEAEMKKLASDDNKEVRVAILTYSTDLETRPELIQADRSLSELLAAKLRELCEANNENVTIVNPHKVEEFKLSHPNWQQEPNLADIGRQFKADYLIYIEISKLSMYETGSKQTLYHGQASLSVQVVDVNKPEESPLPKPVSFVYPDAAGRSRSRTCSRWSSARNSSATSPGGWPGTGRPCRSAKRITRTRRNEAGILHQPEAPARDCKKSLAGARAGSALRGRNHAGAGRIRCRENGPYVVLGDVKIVDHLGNEHTPPAGGKAGVACAAAGRRIASRSATARTAVAASRPPRSRRRNPREPPLFIQRRGALDRLVLVAVLPLLTAAAAARREAEHQPGHPPCPVASHATLLPAIAVPS